MANEDFSERAKKFTTGRITAMQCQTREGDEFWLGKIGGVAVGMKDDPHANKTKEDAMADARAFKQHAIKAANKY